MIEAKIYTDPYGPNTVQLPSSINRKAGWADETKVLIRQHKNRMYNNITIQQPLTLRSYLFFLGKSQILVPFSKKINKRRILLIFRGLC